MQSFCAMSLGHPDITKRGDVLAHCRVYFILSYLMIHLPQERIDLFGLYALCSHLRWLYEVFVNYFVYFVIYAFI